MNKFKYETKDRINLCGKIKKMALIYVEIKIERININL